MVNSYIELSEEQQNNLFFFLDRSTKNHLNILKDNFNIKAGKDLVEYRNNVLHGLMMNQINFSFFTNWLAHVDLNGNNTLFVYEPENTNIFTKTSFKKLQNKCKSLCSSIYDVCVNTLNGVKIVNVWSSSDEGQILITFAAPSLCIQNNDERNAPELVRNVYLAYLTIDFRLKHFVLSLHPTSNLHSVNGIRRTREMEEIALHFINYFRTNILPFNFSNPEWIVDALCKITEEYFDHNNPIINKKMEEFENTLLNDVLKLLQSKEPIFKRKDYHLRLKNGLMTLYENELIEAYRIIPKKTPFKVFSHSADKGITTFIANSYGKPLNLADSRPIIKKMLENAHVNSLGIIYDADGVSYPYKVSKSAYYYSLKRITIAGTAKEIVDDVLFNLTKYKFGEKFANSTRAVEKSE
jgi:hypothetical protein